MLYGVMIELYPRDESDPPRLVLHTEPFADHAAAVAYIDKARRQNLPFKCKWIISFNDPREDSDVQA